MGNILRVWKRDVLRLFKAPAALVVIAVLVALPSLYTWFNVVGFWNPYENTQGLRVCVVNEDTGASTELTGDIDVGAQIIEEIHQNDQLGWEFTTREQALDEVESGRAYAAFVIPADFSSNITSLTTGDFEQPKLEYYVNEKAGAVSPKITDAGANTLDQTINSTFVSTVSSVVADAIDKAMDSSQSGIDESQAKVDSGFDKVTESLNDAHTSLSGLDGSLSDAINKANDAKGNLQQTKSQIDDVAGQIQDVANQSVDVQNNVNSFAAKVPGVFDRGSLLLSSAISSSNQAIGSSAGSINNAKGQVDGAVKQAQSVIDANVLIILSLEQLRDTLPAGDPNRDIINATIDRIRVQNSDLQQSLDRITQTAATADVTAGNIAALGLTLNNGATATLTAADRYRTILSENTLPSINSGVSQLAGATSTLSASVSDQKIVVDQAILVIDQLVSTLNNTRSALNETNGMISGLQSDLDTVRTDLKALSTSTAITDLLGESNIDANKVAQFMLSPTTLTTESLYPLNAYGSAMAPLFTNLTLWIGVFMLMVILKQEVDGEGIKNLTITQSYIARWLFLAPLVALQAIICVTGNLIIGVQSVNPLALYLTAIMASLAYLCIQFSLSVTLQHIGKGICIILVFVQIPGATGLYPIEMTPEFFRNLYPFFPFTYGINAMRECIAGFYGNAWLTMMGILLVFAVLFFVLGLLLRPYFTNLNRLFAQQIEESDILNGEEVQVPPRRFRLGQLIRALSDREEYRVQLKRHAENFEKWYPRLKHIAWIVGILVPVVVTSLLALNNGEKVIILTCWLIWIILIMVFLTAIEFLRDNYTRQQALDDMSNDDLRHLFEGRSNIANVPVAPIEGVQKEADNA